MPDERNRYYRAKAIYLCGFFFSFCVETERGITEVNTGKTIEGKM